MFESSKNSAIKKSYEIAYALFRISAKISEKSFSEAITAEGIELLRNSASARYEEIEKIILSIEYFMRLGSGVGIVDSANSETLIYELNELRKIIAELLKEGQSIGATQVDLSGIFEKAEFGDLSNQQTKEDNHKITFPESVINETIKDNNNSYFEENEYNPDDDIFEPKKNIKEFGNDTFGNNLNVNYSNSANEDLVDNSLIKENNVENKDRVEVGNIFKSGNRQTAILDRVRQFGSCRIKDLCQLFPSCSERTLRYDLQSLIEQNLIERIGVVGPAVYYRSKVRE